MMTVNDADQFIIDPAVPAAVADGIALLIGVPNGYTTVNLTKATRRLTSQVVAMERKLQTGTVQANYVVELPANKGNANGTTISNNLEAARNNLTLGTDAVQAGINNAPNLNRSYTVNVVEVGEESVTTFIRTTSTTPEEVRPPTPPPPPFLQDLITEAMEDPIVTASVGGGIVAVCLFMCLMVCICRCCRNPNAGYIKDDDSVEEEGRDDPGAAAAPVFMPAEPAKLEPAETSDDLEAQDRSMMGVTLSV